MFKRFDIFSLIVLLFSPFLLALFIGFKLGDLISNIISKVGGWYA